MYQAFSKLSTLLVLAAAVWLPASLVSCTDCNDPADADRDACEESILYLGRGDAVGGQGGTATTNDAGGTDGGPFDCDAPDAPESPDDATVLEVSDVKVSACGYVGTDPADPADYYSFEVDEAATIELTTNVSGRVWLYFYQDAMGLNEDQYFVRFDSEDEAEHTRSRNLPRGTYFVRVVSYDGYPSNEYSFSLQSEQYSTIEEDPEPGEDHSDAYDLGVLGNAQETVGSYVGTAPLDDVDYYRFELDEAATVELTTKDVNSRVLINVYQEEMGLNEDRSFAEFDSNDDADRTHYLNLPRGVYFVRVVPHEEYPGHPANLYTLTFQSEEYSTVEEDPEPGDESSEAFDLGSLGTSPETVGGYVGTRPGDPSDYYRFELDEAATVELTTESVKGRVSLYFYQEERGLSEDQFFDEVDSEDSADHTKFLYLPRGVYFVRVVPHEAYPGHPANLYTFTLQSGQYSAAEANPDPGEDRSEAFDLGAFGASGEAVGGYVGTLDAVDYYRIELADAATIEFTTEDMIGRVTLYYYHEDSGLSEDQFFDSSDSSDSTPDVVELPAGIIFVRVVPEHGSNLYTFFLQPVP